MTLNANLNPPPAWSSIPSNLPGANQIYDFVVAVTQDSINVVLDEFISGLFASSTPPPLGFVEIVFTSEGHVIDANISAMSLSDFSSQLTNVYPFSIPQGTPFTDPRVQSLYNANFVGALKFIMGLPAVAPPATLPGWVDFSSNSSSSVIFSMMCSTFALCHLSIEPSGPVWNTYTQTPATGPVIIPASVNLNLSATAIDPNSPVYHSLPTNLQNMVQNPGAFSIQQLLLDLTTANIPSTFLSPILDFGPTPQNNTVIKSAFLAGYIDQMKVVGIPPLGLSVVPTQPSTFQPTFVNFQVNNYLNADGTPSTDPNTQGLATLNYMCLTGGSVSRSLTPVHFTWNWVDQSEEISFNGAVSINRDSLVAYFMNELLPYVTPNCYNIHVTVTTDGDNGITYSFPMTGGQTPTIAQPKGAPDGSTVLTYDWTSPSQFSSDQAGLDGDLGKMTMKQTYHMGVQFIGTTIVITQTQVVWASISKNLTTDSANIIDRTRVDTYTLGVIGTGQPGVGQSGQLTVAATTTNSNNDINPSSNPFTNWFTDINSIINKVESYVGALVTYNMQQVPLSIIQNFIFPGGKTFVFKGAAFAQTSLDLVAEITYDDPEGQ